MNSIATTECATNCPTREPTDPVPIPPLDGEYPPAEGQEGDPDPAPAPDKRNAPPKDKNGVKDFDGDGLVDGVLIGPLEEQDVAWCGTPFALGVAHQSAGGSLEWTSIERWGIGTSSQELTAALMDPWSVQAGDRALAVTKDTVTGACALREVVRGAVMGTQSEHNPDGSVGMSSTKYSTTTSQSLDLALLFPGQHVAGAELWKDTEGGLERVLLSPVFAEVVGINVWGDAIVEFSEGGTYVVQRDPVTGALSLQED